jgi:hypothetical protein
MVNLISFILFLIEDLDYIILIIGFMNLYFIYYYKFHHKFHHKLTFYAPPIYNY